MDDIELLIRRTWDALAPTLQSNPQDLHRRLNRLNQSVLNRPPRAWCLALRASDTRLGPYQTKIPARPQPNALVLDRDALQKLCAPVQLDPPGETLAEVAAKLGVSRSALRYRRLASVFQTHHVEGLDGRWCKPRPLLYCAHPLDPSAPLFRPPDPIWSWTATYLTSRIPKDLRVTLIRVPTYYDRTRRYDSDPTTPPPHHSTTSPPPSPKRRLPPPKPDPVPYKWDGDYFLGYDWRSKNPHIEIGYRREQHRRQLNREAAARYRANHRPALSLSKGSLHFWGWRWLCPRCNKPVNLLFYPLPPLELFIHATTNSPLEATLLKAGILKRVSPHRVTASPLHCPTLTPDPDGNHQVFACNKCHHVHYSSSSTSIGWNEIVSFLTRGLLYGHEVPRPNQIQGLDGPIPLSTTPKIPYKPRPNRSPSLRRPQIESLLLSGIPPYQIAHRLGTTSAYVINQARIIYRHHNVRSLKQFAKKHNITFPKPDRPRQPNGKFLPTPRPASTTTASTTSIPIK